VTRGTRNVRTYDHFCFLARALERVGDRWSLLVVRDLLTGPKRFTDLMDRLGGITPKTLTQRLRELGDVGILTADRAVGRREVWYHLTPTGAELGPVIEQLAGWGWRHAWSVPDGGQPLHPEHLLLSLVVLLNEAPDRRPTHWHLHFTDDGDYVLSNDGTRWTLRSVPPPPDEPADVTVVTTTAAWLSLLLDPTSARAAELGVDITGPASARRNLLATLRTFPASIPKSNSGPISGQS
jgi:DNA-binding HxlR family transcriptional regulator